MIDLSLSDESHAQHEDSSDQDLDEEHRIGGLGIIPKWVMWTSGARKCRFFEGSIFDLGGVWGSIAMWLTIRKPFPKSTQTPHQGMAKNRGIQSDTPQERGSASGISLCSDGSHACKPSEDLTLITHGGKKYWKAVRWKNIPGRYGWGV